MDKDVNLINKRECYGTALIVSDRCVYSWTCCYSRYTFSRLDSHIIHLKHEKCKGVIQDQTIKKTATGM